MEGEHKIEEFGPPIDLENLTSFWNLSDYYSEEDSCFTNYLVSYTFAAKITIGAVYTSVFIAALVGNIFLLYTLLFSSSSTSLRPPAKYLMVNLALGDLLTAILCIPFTFVPVILQYWPFGGALCFILSPAQGICVFVSCFSLVALISVRYREALTHAPALEGAPSWAMILAIWVGAIVTSIPIAVFTEYHVDPDFDDGQYYVCEESGWESMNLAEYEDWYGLGLMFLHCVVPFSYAVYAYARLEMESVAAARHGSTKEPRVNNETPAVFSRTSQPMEIERKRTTKILGVVMFYSLSWFPFYIFTGDKDDRLWCVFYACHLLAMNPTMVNPLAVAWIHSDTRRTRAVDEF